MNRPLAFALALLLTFAILTVWVPARWPVAVLQCGAFALAAAVLLRRRPFVRSTLLIPLAGIVLWTLLQLALNLTVYRHDTWDALLIWSTNLAVFFAALQLSATDLTSRWRAAAGFGAVLAILTMLQLFTSPGRIFWIFPVQIVTLPAGPFLSRNQYAACIELLLPIAIAAAVRDRAHRPACLVMAALMYASVVAVASRAGAVLVTAEVFVLLAQAFHRRQISGRAIAAALAVLLLFTAAAGWTTLASRWRDPQGYQIRAELLRSSLCMIRDRPLAGFGMGTWSTVYPAYARYDDGSFVNQAHNDWAQFAAEGGIPMLLFMLWIAAAAIRPALILQWPIGLLAVLVHALVDYPLQKPALAALFFALLGAAAHASSPDSSPAGNRPGRDRVPTSTREGCS